MLPSSSTDVTFFEGPGIRAAEQRTFVDVRRIGTESIFVAVHEPHGGTPRVRSAELVPIQSGSEMAVALRVTLVDRTDTILSTLDHTGTLTTTDVSFRGRFGFLSDAQSGNRSLYLADAELLYAGGSRLETSAAHTGSVLRTMIAEQGDAMDAFIIDSPVPDGDHAGKLFLTTDGDGSTRGFIIKSASGTTVEVDRNPGMSVENGYVKLQYFPNWGIPGDLSFRIISTALQTNP